MAFYDTADFIDQFRNGGCFIFEGEEDQEPEQEQSPDESEDEVTERQSDDEPDNGAADVPPPPPEPPQSDDVKATDPEAVNTDDENKGKQTLTADEVVNEFKKSGALKATMQYAMTHLKGSKQTITLRTLLPYVKAGVEKFCQKQTFSTSVAEMAKAIMEILKGLSTKEVQKAKMKAAEAKKQQEKKQAEEQQQQQSAPSQDAGGESPPEAPSGGDEKAPAPADGDAEKEAPQEN